MIKLEGVTKRFGDVVAVDDVSFEVISGEIVGFLGPNGAGKTTTMRLITGFLAADTGSITVEELDVQAEPVKVKQKIGYLPEDNPLYPYLQVEEYLKFIAEVRQLSLNDYYDRLISVCGLKQVLHKSISQLSRGFRQRVGLAAAMIHNPAVLILDEPTSGLDPNQIIEIRSLIKELGQEKTVILSTHILSEVEATCDRIIIIDKGRIVGQGTVKALTTDVDKSLEQVFRELTLGQETEKEKVG